MSRPKRQPLWWQRVILVCIGVPIALLLMLVDAASAAWSELRRDWTDAVASFKDVWRNG